jgi:hypothetical protein
MAGLSPNSANIQRTRRATQQVTHLVVHPEYEYWRPEWTKIRDAIAGEREIKRKGAIYLRPMKGADNDQYAEYLDRAVFYNMSGQTLSGMVGQMFRRPPTIRNLPTPGGIIARAPDGGQEIISPASDKFTTQLQRFAKDGTTHQGFAKTAAMEQIGLGRFGALVDVTATASSAPQSYVVGYAAENIVDWTVEDVDGFYVPTRILLREFERVDEHATPSQNNPWIGREGSDTTGAGSVRSAGRKRDKQAQARADAVVRPTRFTSSYAYRTIYRELVLEFLPDRTRVYKQYVYVEDPLGQARDVFTPNVRGQTLDFIPFVFFGAASNAADCEKPPLLDIVDLNLKHYRTYAELEHGRFYTALPTYYAPGNQDNDAAEYHIGPGTVWEVPSGETPGILEFKGEGLKTLERALNEKEQQIAAIGGRLMPGMSKSTSESNNQSAMREANEQALLLNVVLSLEDGMTMLVRYWLMFRDIPLSADRGPDLRDRHDLPERRPGRPRHARDPDALRVWDVPGRPALRIPPEVRADPPGHGPGRLQDQDGRPRQLHRPAGRHGDAPWLRHPRPGAGAEPHHQGAGLPAAGTRPRRPPRRYGRGEAADRGGGGQHLRGAARKLGDPEQAAPAQADAGVIKNQANQIRSQAAAAKLAAKRPAPAPAVNRKPGPGQ